MKLIHVCMYCKTEWEAEGVPTDKDSCSSCSSSIGGWGPMGPAGPTEEELYPAEKKPFPEFKGFNKIPRLSREIIITEKIDGTNGIIYIDEDNNIFAGSRKRWLWGSIQDEVHNDNYGFAKWVKANKEELLQLGKGYHYGEWMGQGIQRNYGLKEKRFYLFNVGRWCLYNEEPKLISIDQKTKIEKYQDRAPQCCSVVPVLYRGDWFYEGYQNLFFAPTHEISKLFAHGSKAVPNFMKPEGIVIYHTASGQLFKKTIDNDEKPKGLK